MNGVIGIFQPGCLTPPSSELELACRLLAHRGPFQTFIAPGIALAAETVTTVEGLTIAFSGRLDSTEEVPSPYIARMYRQHGGQFAESLAGEFSLALFDSGRNVFFLVRDPLGTQPIHFSYREGVCSFAPESKAIASCQHLPRFGVLAEYLAPGLSPNHGIEETCWEGIDSVPPSHCLRVDTAGTHLERYWDFDDSRVQVPHSLEGCVERFEFLLRQAVRRRTRESFAVAVSGGLDSSSLLCLSSEQTGPRGFGLSYVGNEPQNDESIFLDALEKKVSLPIERFQIPPLPSEESLRVGFSSQIRRVEAPLVDSLWPLFDTMCKVARRGGAKTLLTGHWGDQILFCPEYLIDAVRAGKWIRLLDLFRFRRYFGWQGARALAVGIARGALKSLVPASVMGPLRSWKRSRRPDPRLAPFRGVVKMECFTSGPSNTPTKIRSHYGRALYGEVRSRFSVWCLEWNEKVAATYGVRMAHPFLDRDLLEFLMALPGHWATHGGVPRFLLRQSMKRHLPAEIGGRRGKGDFTALAHRTAQGVSSSVGELLNDRSAIVKWGLMPLGALQPLVANLLKGLSPEDGRATWRLLDLLALELWLGSVDRGESQ